MRRQKLFGFTAVTVVAFVLGHGVATAQAQGTVTPPDATAGVTRQVNLSPAEELTQTEANLGRMDASRTNISTMLASARAQRDVVKTLCLNDKLNQVDVAVRSARERKQQLEAAVKSNDTDLANHEFTILTVLRQRSDQLSAEANQCIGKEVETLGENLVKSSIDPGLPAEDPWLTDIINTVVNPPSCGSCFK